MVRWLRSMTICLGLSLVSFQLPISARTPHRIPPVPATVEGMAIWAEAVAKQGKIPFYGRKTMTVRRDRDFRSDIEVTYAGPEHYSLGITTPESRSQLGFGYQNGQTWAEFPDDGLSFRGGSAETQLFAAQVMLQQLPSWPLRARPQGYWIHRLPDEIVALTPCDVLEFQPQLQSDAKPRIRYWIGKQHRQILRVQYYHDPYGQRAYTQNSYFDSAYTLFRPLNPGQTPKGPEMQGGVRVDLGHTAGNAFRTYATAEAAASAEQLVIYQPGYLPPGFSLQQVQVLRVFGVPIQLQTYSDGLNLMSVAVQPEIDPFGILLSGIVNLNYYAITWRMIGLKAYAPYDFFSRFTKANQTIVFGELSYAELRTVSASLPVP